MAVEIVMPRFGWTAEEGTLVEWLKADGDMVHAEEVIFTVESDKALNEVEALDSGILRIPPDSPPPGSTVAVGTLLAYLVQPGQPAPYETPGAGKAERDGQREGIEITKRPQPSRPQGPTRARRSTPAISPRARRVAAELDVDWTKLSGSGRTSRIVERDVRAAAAQMKAAKRQAREAETVVAVRQRPPIPPPSAPLVGQTSSMTQVRRRIAEHVVESLRTTAPVTLTIEVDATEFVILHQQLKETFTSRDINVPTYNDLIIKLTAVALDEHPMLNSRWTDDSVTIFKEVHVGIAVDTEDGLLVPVLRDVQIKNLRQIAAESHALTERARTRQLSPEDMRGGTFTVTNLGMYGIDTFTPIINTPQCAILGVGQVVSKPVVRDDEIVPRRMMSLSLTFDHRIVDGAPAAQFLSTLREYIETPTLWLV